MQLSRFSALALLLVLSPYASAQGAASKFLPSDTEVLFTVNFEQILNSEIVKANKELAQQARFMIENKLQEAGAQQFLQKAGIDLFRDLHSLTIAGPGTRDTDKVVVILQGKFNPDKLKSAAQDAALANADVIKVGTLDNQPLYQISPPNGNGKTLYAATVGTDYLLASPSQAVFKTTADQIRGGQTTELPNSLKSLLQAGGAKQSISMTATGPALARLSEAAPNPNEMVGAYLKNVVGLNLGITLAKDIQFQLGVNTSDKETAEQFSKMGNALLLGVRGMVAQKAQEEAKLMPAVEVVQTLRIVTQGNNVLLRGEVSHDTLGKILKNLPQK